MTQNTHKINDLTGVIKKGIIPMTLYKEYEISNINNELNIEKQFAPGGDGDKELYLLENSRVTASAGWLFEYKGKKYIVMFSRTAKMYIGNKFHENEDIETNLHTLDIMTASRIVWPHKGYTTGGKVAALRNNNDYMNMIIKEILFHKSMIAHEVDEVSKELAYMTVGLINYGEVKDWFFKILNDDEFTIILEVNEALEKKDQFKLTAKAEVFYDLLEQYIKNPS